MKKAILTFTLFVFVIATHAQVKMHSDGRITFQTLVNSTTQGISFGPAPDCTANFNGDVYFKKNVLFIKNAHNHEILNCSKADSALTAVWAVYLHSWNNLNFYVHANGNTYAKNNYILGNQ